MLCASINSDVVSQLNKGENKKSKICRLTDRNVHFMSLRILRILSHQHYFVLHIVHDVEKHAWNSLLN